MKRKAYLLLAPLMLLLGFVEVYPVVATVYLSIVGFGEAAGPPSANYYIQMLSDPQLASAVYTSVAFATGGTILAFVIGVGFAFLLTQLRRGRRLVETLLLVPLAVAPLIAGVAWAPQAIWDDLNTFIHFALGLPYVDVTNYFVYFPTMTLSYGWEWAPMMMLVALSVVGSIPEQVLEAAEVHGASAWGVFRRISFPAILRSPVTGFVLIITFVDALRAFEIPFAWSTWLAQPNAGSPVDTLSLLLFKLLVVPTYGLPIPQISAVAVALLVVTLVAAIGMMNLMRRLGAIQS